MTFPDTLIFLPLSIFSCGVLFIFLNLNKDRPSSEVMITIWFLFGFSVAISISTFYLIDLISENNGDITAKAVPYVLGICLYTLMVLHLLMRFRSK